MNKLWARKGSVFAERHLAHILRTPRDVRNALAYVLNNIWRHIRGVHLSANSDTADGVDGFTSGYWFDGWRTETRFSVPEAVGP